VLGSSYFFTDENADNSSTYEFSNTITDSADVRADKLTHRRVFVPYAGWHVFDVWPD